MINKNEIIDKVSKYLIETDKETFFKALDKAGYNYYDNEDASFCLIKGINSTSGFISLNIANEHIDYGDIKYFFTEKIEENVIDINFSQYSVKKDDIKYTRNILNDIFDTIDQGLPRAA